MFLQGELIATLKIVPSVPRVNAAQQEVQMQIFKLTMLKLILKSATAICDATTFVHSRRNF